MRKIFKTGHVTIVVLLIVYCGLELLAFIVKLLSPQAESVRFWQLGPEVGVTAVALLALSGILACSTGLLKPRVWQIPAILHGTWLACLTWFGWFSIRAPFRLHELVRVDLDDPRAVRAAELLQTAQAAAVFVAIVVLTSLLPLMALKRSDEHRGQAAR